MHGEPTLMSLTFLVPLYLCVGKEGCHSANFLKKTQAEMSLVQAVVGSVILIHRRQSSELYPESWRNLWKEWQLRGLILLSLTAQIALVILGNRRKCIAKTWIQTIVWSSYLLADSVATMAIGVLSNNIADVYWNGNSTSHTSDYELKAFWAPFLLMHLGGMDTITAYSLEDNELWMRHFFSLVIQAATTVYILLMSWSTSSRLSPLFIVVFLVGLVKYCERVWALFSASEKRFRDSIPENQTSESKIMEECNLRQLEGYHVTVHQVLEVEVPVFDDSVPNCDDAIEILMAHSFLEMVKRLFADLILGFQDRDASRAIFESTDIHWNKALKVVEIELGLIYDAMYTKAMVVYSSWGVAGRIIGSFLILGVLVMVSLDKGLAGKNSSKIDQTITLVLLVVALLLDSCAFGELLLSDQTAHRLIISKKFTLLRSINCIRTIIPTNWGRKRRRWSGTMKQYSLLSFCFATRVKPLFCLRILRVFGIQEVAEIYMYKSITPPAQLYFDRMEDLPSFFFLKLKVARSTAENNGESTDLKSLFGRRGGLALKLRDYSDLQWSVQIEFHQSVLIWHLATDICYRLDHLHYDRDRCKCMSQYMLYLLVEHPNMLPIGMGQIKFRDLYSDLGDFIEMYLSKPLKDVTEIEASKMLMEIVNLENMLVGGGDRSNFVILHACKLASQLGKLDQDPKWDVIKHVWFEMLGHAASQCKGRHHAQQLRQGGEYLTHLWLLMAHFGFTDNFQILRSRPIADAVLRNQDEQTRERDSKGKEIAGIKRRITRPPLNFLAILNDFGITLDTTCPEKLCHQLYAGIYLKPNTLKYFVDEKSNKNCFMLFPREFYVCHGENPEHWQLIEDKDTSGEDIEVLKLLKVWWLDIVGSIQTIDLSPRTKYEIVFIVKIMAGHSNFSFTLNIYPQYTFQSINAMPQYSKALERSESLQGKPLENWFEILVGEFMMSPQYVGNMAFRLQNHDGGVKQGLVLKCAIIRPKM